jgi:hypothetical protein
MTRKSRRNVDINIDLKQMKCEGLYFISRKWLSWYKSGHFSLKWQIL